MVLVRVTPLTQLSKSLEGPTMKRYSFSLAAAMLFAGTAAFAEISPQTRTFIDNYLAGQQFDRAEVRVGLTQIKIEAYRGTEKVEVILDKTSGRVLKSETETVGLPDDDSADDFLRVDDDSNDDEDGDDSDDDSDDSSDDDSDDNSDGSDDSDNDSNDDDSNDDNGDDDRNDDDSSGDNGDDSSGDNGDDD